MPSFFKANKNIKRTSFKSPKRKIALDSRHKKLVFLTYIASGILILMIIGIVGVFGLFAYYSRELPNPNTLLNRSDELSTKLYDKNGKSLFEVYGEKNRSLVKLSDISPNLVKATLAIEDAEFYNHQGFSFKGMLRAVRNTVTGEGLQGGSTLTQQVVKTTLLTQERTLVRKIKEFILALQLESKYSKNEIIQMYLNEVPYGGQNYGVFTAARAYFNKAPGDLTLAEAAYLAGLPQSPSVYSYFGSNPEAGLERKNYVLYVMNTKGWIGDDGNRYFISDEDYETAKNEELSFVRPDVFFEAPHFVFYAKQVLSEMFGEEYVEQGGLTVTTTLDLDLQKKAEEIVKTEVEAAKNLRVGNGALVAIDPKTGGVLAMVGSKDYFGDPEPEGCISGVAGIDGCVFDPNVNVSISPRQPGSSIKPITYAAMISQGYSLAFPFLDVQTKFPGSAPDKPYIPENYDGIFRGPVPLRKALGNSLNIPAVKALRIVGIDNMLELAEKMGITTLTDRNRYGLALTLGGGETKLLEMTGVYATFANKGEFIKPNPILKVTDANNNVLYEYKPNKERVLSEDVAFLISDILSDNGARSDAFGPNSLLNIPGHQVAVKTGTTNDTRDNYAMGYTPSIAVGVWVGNNNNIEMSNVASGITGATPIWHNFMAHYLNGKEPEKFEATKNVEKIRVDSLTGMLPFEDFSSREEWFIKDNEPTSISSWYQKLEICDEDNKLASDACRNADKTDVETFIDIQAEIPEWQNDVDAWIGENYSGDDKYFPPRIKSALEFEDDGDVKDDTDPHVKITNFENGGIAPLSFRLKVEVSSPNDISEVRIYMDGNRITTDKSEPFGYNFNLTSNDVGKHEFEVVAEDEDGREDSDKISLTVIDTIN